MNKIWSSFSWLVPLACICIACQGSFADAPHCREIDRVTKKFIHSITEKYDLQLFASGGAMMTNIKEVHLEFSAPYSVDIAKARRIIVDVVCLLLHDINSDIGVRPYLANHPFLPKNIAIGIGFERNPSDSTSIQYVIVINNEISYNIRPEKYGYKEIYVESWTDAVDQVDHGPTSD